MGSKILPAIVVLLTYAALVHSYGSGAPSTDDVCRSMKPHHGAEPQTSSSPFEITVDRTEIQPRDRVRVTLKSKAGKEEEEFKGFLIYTLKTSSGKHIDPSSQGRFTVLTEPDSKSSNAKLTDCFGKRGSSITHTNNSAKKEFTFLWRAPRQEGEYRIIGTVVKSFDKFWTRVLSDTITVRASKHNSGTSTSNFRHDSAFGRQ